MSIKSNRRDFLRSTALGIGTLGLTESLAVQLFQHLTSKAFAQTVMAGANPSGYYFHLSLAGGPPRWGFDLPLTPFAAPSASNIINPGGFGTIYEKVGSSTNVTYQALKVTAAGKSLFLPPVWTFNTSKNFQTLLPHCLFVRGIDMEINSHPVSRQRQISPAIGGTTIAGAVADQSTRALPSITDGGLDFKSNRGLTPTRFAPTAANPITSALSPFAKLPASRRHIAGQNLSLQEQVLSRLESDFIQSGYSENTLSDSYNKAADVVESNIQSLGNLYGPTRAKYQNLINAALRPSKGSLPGVFSNPIPVSKTSATFDFLQPNFPANTVTVSDVRDMVTGSIVIPGLAERFAVMEILTNRLSTNFTLNIPQLQNVNIGSRLLTLSNDQHTTGKHIATMLNTLYFRAILSCLTEFVDFLKAEQIFDKSIIHISSEFNRTPRVDGTGSDHGWEGGNVTLISGKFSQPNVIGNIRKNGSGLGTWGMASPFHKNSKGAYTGAIKVNDIARTITGMLAIADVTTNGESLVEPTSGGQFKVKNSKNEANNV